MTTALSASAKKIMPAIASLISHSRERHAILSSFLVIALSTGTGSRRMREGRGALEGSATVWRRIFERLITREFLRAGNYLKVYASMGWSFLAKSPERESGRERSSGHDHADRVVDRGLCISGPPFTHPPRKIDGQMEENDQGEANTRAPEKALRYAPRCAIRIKERGKCKADDRHRTRERH